MTIRPRRSLAESVIFRPSALNSVPRPAEALWLDKNENLDSVLLEVTHRVLHDVPAEAMATYPEPGELYRRLAAWVGVMPESLILTPGSDGAIRQVFEAFVEHGDSVVITSPTFAMYPVYCAMYGAQVSAIEYVHTEAGPRLPLAQLVETIERIAPKLVCLPNPDSPTGCVQAPGEIAHLLNVCERAGAVLLLDEAYHPFYGWSAVDWTARFPNLIVARTLAKAWGAAGLRVGYAVAQPSTIGLLHQMRPMYELGTVAIEAAVRLVGLHEQMEASVRRVLEGKEYFCERMRSLGYRTPEAAGNFLLVEFGTALPAIEAALAGKVLFRASMAHPSLRGVSRFSAAPRAVMTQVADLIQEAS